MDAYSMKVTETAKFLREKIHRLPKIGFLTGTGLGGIADVFEPEASFSYAEIPHFPVTTVESHTGRLLFGVMAEKPILALQGRFHLYEGYAPRDVVFPIRVMQDLGIRVLILSNAAGGLNPSFRAGDIMIISDHINLTGENPLIGPNQDRWGPRFPEMVAAYDTKLKVLAETVAEELDMNLQQGVYAGLKGPSLESPAEVRFLKVIGADAVGFSTVQEVIAGVHAGMKILGISVITNVHNPDHPDPMTLEAVLRVAGAATPKVGKLLREILKRLDFAVFS